MTHNSRQAWKTIRMLSNDPTSSSPQCIVNANQVAHQLLVNGRGNMPSKPKRPVIPETEAGTSMVSPFSKDEYRKGVAILKNNKTAGRDDVLVEQLKNLGPNAHKWLRAMLNNCFIDNKIPTIWRQSKIIAILKPGRDSAIPKIYRPISLLCHTYKLYERLILNRKTPTIEQHLIKEQAGFRAGKSCTSQLLNLTQHIGSASRNARLPELPLLIYLLHTTQWTIDSWSRSSTTSHKTVHCVESHRTYCQTEDSMWNWTTNEADRDYRRIAYPKVVFSPYPFQYLHKRSAHPWWNKEFHLRRRSVYHSPVPDFHGSRRYYWGGTERIDTILQKQQSACKPWQDASHSVPSTEQRVHTITKYSMKWGRTGEHCLS